MNVHRDDPITSYEAAAAIAPVRHAHKAKVLAALAQHPGAIASELAEVVGFGLLTRLRCKGCGAGVVALRDAA